MNRKVHQYMPFRLGAIRLISTFQVAGHGHGLDEIQRQSKGEQDHPVNKKRLLSQLISTRFMQVLVLHYENVKADPSGQIKRALDFLGVPSDWDRLECAEKHKNGYFWRKKVLMPHKLLYYP